MKLYTHILWSVLIIAPCTQLVCMSHYSDETLNKVEEGIKKTFGLKNAPNNILTQLNKVQGSHNNKITQSLKMLAQAGCKISREEFIRMEQRAIQAVQSANSSLLKTHGREKFSKNENEQWLVDYRKKNPTIYGRKIAQAVNKLLS